MKTTLFFIVILLSPIAMASDATYDNLTVKNKLYLTDETIQPGVNEDTSVAIISSKNGSRLGHYQFNLMNGDNITSWGNYYLFNTGGGVTNLTKIIYGNTNEMYLSTRGNDTNYAKGFGSFNYANIDGDYARYIGTTNIGIDIGRYTQNFGTQNILSSTGKGATLIGTQSTILGGGATGQVMGGEYYIIQPDDPSDTAFGGYITADGTGIINNPTSQQVGVYINWNIPGEDINYTKWGLYIERTQESSGKSFFGDPVSIGSNKSDLSQMLTVHGTGNVTEDLFAKSIISKAIFSYNSNMSFYQEGLKRLEFLSDGTNSLRGNLGIGMAPGQKAVARLFISSGLKTASDSSTLKLTSSEEKNPMQLQFLRTGNNAWSIYSAEQGIAWRDLNLNPYGGRVSIGGFNGTSTFNVFGSATITNLAGIGNAYVCVDANGKIYRSLIACT